MTDNQHEHKQIARGNVNSRGLLHTHTHTHTRTHTHEVEQPRTSNTREESEVENKEGEEKEKGQLSDRTDKRKRSIDIRKGSNHQVSHP